MLWIQGCLRMGKTNEIKEETKSVQKGTKYKIYLS